MALSEQQREALQRLLERRNNLDPERRALVEEMAKANNIPIQPRQPKQEDPLTLLHDVADSAKVATLPMLGQAAFGLAGAPAGPAGIVAGEVVGGLIGTKANEMLGISRPTETDYALSGGAPLLPPAVSRFFGGKFGRHLIPGMAAAEQEIGVQRMRMMQNILESPGKDAVNQAYSLVGTAPLKVSKFAETVNRLKTTEEGLKEFAEQNPRILRSLTKTAAKIEGEGGELAMTDVNGLLKRYREKADSLEGKGGEQWGVYKALRRAIFQDMDTAVAAGAGKDAALLRQAMQTAKKQLLSDELSGVIKNVGVKAETVGTATFETIHPTAVLNKLKKMGFDEAIGWKQWQKIESTLKELAKIPHPTSQLRTGIGTPGRAIAMTGAGIIGAGAATTLAGAGAREVMGSGAGAALLALASVKAFDAVANLMMNDAGRKFLVKMFKHNGGAIGPRTAQVLQFAASQFQDTGDITPVREKQISGLVNLATTPDVDAERRLRLGLRHDIGPNQLPSLRQG